MLQHPLLLSRTNIGSSLAKNIVVLPTPPTDRHLVVRTRNSGLAVQHVKPAVTAWPEKDVDEHVHVLR